MRDVVPALRNTPLPRNTPLQYSAVALFTAVALLGILRFKPTFLPLVVSVYWADIAILGAAILWLLHVRSFSWTAEIRWLSQTGVIFLLLLFIALLGSTLVNGQAVPAAENIIQSVRFITYGIILLFLADLAVRTDMDWARAAHPIVIAVVTVNIAVVLIQLLNPPVLGSLIHALWGDEKLRSLASGYPRVFGTFFNANWFGVFAAWCLAYSVAASRNFSSPARLGVFVAAGIFMLAVSGSRTGMLATLTGLSTTAVLVYGIGRRERVRTGRLARLALIVTLGAVLGAVVWTVRSLDLSRFLQRYTELMLFLSTPGDAEILTFSSRMRAWSKAFGVFRASPVFGIGGSTATGGVAPHNGYIAMLMNFGIVGAAGLAAFVLSTCGLAWVQLRYTPGSRRLRAWFFGFTAAFAVAMLAGDFVYTSHLLFLWFLLVALMVGQSSFFRAGHRPDSRRMADPVPLLPR